MGGDAGIRGRSERGAALLELALATPVVLVILFGVIDFARVFYVSQHLTAVARLGAQYGTRQLTFDATGVQSYMAGVNPNIAPYTVPLPTQTCSCMDDAAVPVSGSTSCSQTCTSPNHLVVTVTVSATKTFSMVAGMLPFPSIAMTRTVTMRAR